MSGGLTAASEGRLGRPPPSRQMTPRKRSSDERSGGLYGVLSVRRVRVDSAISEVRVRSAGGQPQVTFWGTFLGSFWTPKIAPTRGFRRHGAYGAAGMLRKSAPNGLNAQIPPLGSIWRRGEACWAWASGDGLGRQALT